MVVKWWELSYMKHTKHLCFAIHSLIHLFIHSLSRSGTRGVLPFNDIQYLGIVKSFIYTFSFIHSLTIKELIQWSPPLWTKSSIQILLFIHSFVPLFIHPFIHSFIHFLGVGWGGVLVYETHPAFSRRYGGQNPGRLYSVHQNHLHQSMIDGIFFFNRKVGLYYLRYKYLRLSFIPSL